MKKYGLNELRKMYLEFFESKNHLKMNSFPLVPKNDKSLLLINAGMTPLKPYFTGQEVPPSKRVTTCQKCIRTGDIENVGKTQRHGTFFEMLGNFSFGDYFKEEAIEWAWEFVTKVLELPEDKLYVSIYLEDDEAEKIWHEKIGLPKDRIIRLGKEDNFWEHGTGPCGPCSEIHYDRGVEHGCGSPDCKVGCDCDRFMEFWNLVFTQFEKTEDGQYVPLDFPNIDTGMGLERLALLMQEVDSIFDIDTIQALLQKVCDMANVKYKEDPQNDISIRLITDHIRSVSFMISDGILPSNEGRGYVLRRLLRRAARHGKLLGIEGKFLAKLCETVIEVSKEAYPELEEKKDYITKIITVEEDRFNETIDQGLGILKTYIDELEKEGNKKLSGEKAFKLYDTYGFPIDLTKEILEESNLLVDEDGFNEEMDKQKTRAREARAESNYMGAEETVYNKLDASLESKFVGYDNIKYSSMVKVLTNEKEIINVLKEGTKGTIFVEETPFYATSGGQMADIGYITTKTGKFEVEDVVKLMGNKIGHVGVVVEGKIEVNQEAELIVDEINRRATAKNHSATHLLQKALRNVLGNHVEQAGSHVTHDKLRFDFTHFQPLTDDEIRRVEEEVNSKIMEGLNIITKEMSIEEAKKLGAMALFGEKYGSTVRVVNMDDYSVELCGGTHISNTSEAGTFKIVSETGVAAGVRRIEALTSNNAINYYKNLEALIKDFSRLLKAEPSMLIKKTEQLMEDNKKVKQENEKLKAKLSKGAADDLLNNVVDIDGVKLLAANIEDQDMNGLRNLGDSLKQKLGEGVIVLTTSKGSKVNLVVMATDEAIKKGAHAGNLIREVAGVVGGGGGGRPNMAQAGGKNPEKIEEALEKAKDVLKTQIK
ncbi:alanine--tRNA ligase [Vallitalea guaymasensis]|uniref:Alanine--tRNA ligase n=2 Tax=Vallitalea guaymasensis TaxID=1185412 RepID=A0A8J8SEN3_9FIRM|nr:alanine--tRNA ligase [Vallitalea guaymasensis]QUH31735.1 alanine--tRNA ligase [Vallitalea guaymasensis]